MTALQSSGTPPPKSETGAFSFGTCGNCGATLSGRYCAQCGEKKFSAHDYSIAHLLEEALDGLTHFDTRFLRTLKVLITRPGELSRAYFHGGRSRYTKPLSLFIIINIVFFFVQPHTGLFGYKYAQYTAIPRYSLAVQDHLRKTGESEVVYAARFNENLQHQKKSILIVAVPFLALVMSLLFMGSGRTYAEHLVLSVQVYAFLLAYLGIVILGVLFPIVVGLTWLFPGVALLRRLGGELAIDTVLGIGLFTYVYLALRRAYETSRVRSVVDALLLSFAVVLTIIAYHSVLFYLTFLTT
ncbi:MAG TPA: DUF3667 domain-containing protein [Gemmatimonadaceae bacterium]|nr:DUF3667 domain-containing protein [Gemmatimonadaceae bacterium]